jgi:hypothetical protein
MSLDVFIIVELALGDSKLGYKPSGAAGKLD